MEKIQLHVTLSSVNIVVQDLKLKMSLCLSDSKSRAFGTKMEQ